MWLNDNKVTNEAICEYRRALSISCPRHVVIDNLFTTSMLNKLVKNLQQSKNWTTQRHTYSALYVNEAQWRSANSEQRFVQRDIWQRQRGDSVNSGEEAINSTVSIETDFLCFLRGQTFMHLLSNMFDVLLTDISVADPKVNTNYFRLHANDFVELHADGSPGREVCMLLYLNNNWDVSYGGDLMFAGKKESKSILPLFNRCVLFDPASEGSEHWVKKMNINVGNVYRYNVTSWYWSK